MQWGLTRLNDEGIQRSTVQRNGTVDDLMTTTTMSRSINKIVDNGRSIVVCIVYLVIVGK